MEFADDLELSPLEQEKLLLHWQRVKEASSRFNLTAVLDDADAAHKHYWDCLAARDELRALAPGSTVLDLGSGAGFPGLVLAAVCPELKFYLLDATAKKCDFLATTAAEMGLDNVEVICGRAEDAGRGELRERVDLVTARAVAPLRELVELALPLLKTGGRLLAMKGSGFRQEIEEAAHALSELKAQAAECREYSLPTGDGRCLLLIEKLAPTGDKYPRRPGLPHKRPL